jgi:hypothetical protein
MFDPVVDKDSSIIANIALFACTMVSVVSIQADVFAKKLGKIGKISRLFDELNEIKS